MKTELQLRRRLVKQINETGWMAARGHYYWQDGKFISRFGQARLKQGVIQICLHSNSQWVTPSGLWEITNDQSRTLAKA